MGNYRALEVIDTSMMNTCCGYLSVLTLPQLPPWHWQSHDLAVAKAIAARWVAMPVQFYARMPGRRVFIDASDVYKVVACSSAELSEGAGKPRYEAPKRRNQAAAHPWESIGRP